MITKPAKRQLRPSTGGAEEKIEERRKRRAAALRLNLAKRKQQTASRAKG